MTKIAASLILLMGVWIEISMASCGSATCPLNNYRYLHAGGVSLTLAREYIDQDEIYVGSARSHVGALPNNHDEVRTLNERSILSMQIGLTDALALSVDIPFVHREHSHVENGNTETFNFSGLGDMVATARYALLTPAGEFAPELSIEVGAKLPTGVTKATSTGGELAEVTIQPGTGSLDFISGVNYRQTLFSVPALSGEFSALPITVGLTYQVNGKGTDDYRIGNILLAHIGTEYQFSKRAAFLLQVNGIVREYADVGSTGEFSSNTGGASIFVSPGLSVQLGDAISASTYVQVPVYIDVHGIQQAARFNLQFSISAGLNLTE